MSEAFLSTLWYRVAGLRPRLRPHLKVSRHRYRGQAWYVVHDIAAGRVHRFTPAAWLMLGQLDGTRTVDEVWQDIARRHEADTPGQDEVIRLLSILHQNDLIQYDGSPDVADLLERYDRQNTQLLKQNLTNPMSFRVPLWDPDRFLTRTLPVVRPLTGIFGFFLWLAVVAAGLATAAVHWDALTANFTDRVLAAENILITLVSYPLIKALHELAHGWLTKARGGEVREMGIMFLVLFPVPYVDASSAAAFPDKWHRVAVSAGGILVETFVAAIAVIVWANAATGFTSAVAFNLAVIGGLSTLIVNGNPLLRFDGYYILADLIEVPNLATRANRFWGHLVERHAFGARLLKEETATWGERVWFILYAPAAYIYRIVVMLGIAWYLAGQFFILGILLAAWTIFQSLVKPVLKHLRHVAVAPRLRKVRRRAMALTYGGTAAILLALAALPVPLRTDTEGVVWLPDEAHVRARAPGFVAAVPVGQGAAVARADTLATLTDPTIGARIEALEWRAEEFRRRIVALETTDRAEARQVALQLEATQAELDRERARAADLTLRAPLAGRFEPAMPPEALAGRFLAEGDLLGYVLPERPDRLRVVVPQDDIDLVRARVRHVEVKLAGHLEERHDTTVLRAVPAALDQLPSPALGQGGGGRFLTAPGDAKGVKSLAPIFVYDLVLPDTMAEAPYGARVIVRFDHGSEPVLAQVWRRVSQLFMRLVDA